MPPHHCLGSPSRTRSVFGTMSGGLPHKPLRPMDMTKSMDLLPKLDGAPLPDWAKKSGGRSMKKSDSGPTLPPPLGEWAPALGGAGAGGQFGCSCCLVCYIALCGGSFTPHGNCKRGVRVAARRRLASCPIERKGVGLAWSAHAHVGPLGRGCTRTFCGSPPIPPR